MSNQPSIERLERLTGQVELLGLDAPSVVTAVARSTLRSRLDWRRPEFIPTQVAGFEDCKEAYDKLIEYSSDAERELIEVAQLTKVGGGAHDVSQTWRHREIPLDDSDQPKVLHFAQKVKMHVANGRFDREQYGSFVEIESYPLVRQTDGRTEKGALCFQGDLIGYVGHTNDRTSHFSIGANELLPASFENIQKQAVDELTKDAQAVALAEFAEEYLAAVRAEDMPLMTVTEFLAGTSAVIDTDGAAQALQSNPYGKYGSPLARVLAGRPNTIAEAIILLKNVFESYTTSQENFEQLLCKPPDDLEAWLSKYHAHQKFKWFVLGMPELHARLNAAIRQTIALGFKARFSKIMEREWQKVELMRKLTAEIGATSDISSCAPETVRP